MEADQQPENPLDRATLERESEVTFFIASGPGGQHRNRNATGVRLVHRPSGITVTATERRSQAANLDMAFARLEARLRAAQTVAAPRIATRKSRGVREAQRTQKRRRGTIKQLRRRITSRDE